MPFYNYVCCKCGLQLEVLRTLADYKTPPNEEELAEHGEDNTCVGGEDLHEMERRLKAAPGVMKGGGWGGGKGYW